MNIHEYQGKVIFREFGIPVPRSIVAGTPEEAEAAARELGGSVVVKAQIHAGGRGKAGGVKKVDGPAGAKKVAEALLGKPLVTHQTGPHGRVVRKLLVEEVTEIASEMYLGIVLDRAQGKVAIMTTAEGGMDIEEVAQNRPEKLHVVAIDPLVGMSDYVGRTLARRLGLTGGQIKAYADIAGAIYRLYLAKDATLVEINPLVITKAGTVIALDAKIGFDDNALFRHPEIQALMDKDEEDPQELEAKGHGLSYVHLDGDIGCMVNGAGLAMGTMDVIQLNGGQPANFLDVGGGATAAKVTAAFQLVLKDSRVKAVLVNIFGGIMKCDTIAEGVIEAARRIQIKVPVVVRLEGTNVDKGRALLKASGLNLMTAENLAEAAKKIVAAAKAA